MTEAKLVKKLKVCNWITLAVLSLAAVLIVGRFFAQSVFVGGLIIIANFGLLYRVLSSTLNPGSSKPAGLIMVTSFLRLAGTGVILFLLIVFDAANPIGLIIGLSTVVLSLMTCGVFLIRRAWKEA